MISSTLGMILLHVIGNRVCFSYGNDIRVSSMFYFQILVLKKLKKEIEDKYFEYNVFQIFT